MVRYTYALRGTPNDPKNEIRIVEKEVHLFKGEQLTEHYLCDINPAGEVKTYFVMLRSNETKIRRQVPVLAPVDSDFTLPDSLEITKYIGRSYPSLLPESHSKQILDLLEQLHGINFYSLTFTGSPAAVEGRRDGLRKQLEGDISDRYRKAIEFKIKRCDLAAYHQQQTSC